MTLFKLTDSELIASFKDAVVEERENFVQQLEHIMELDRRKLFFEHASLWAYLIEEVGMEDSAAERKIRASRLLKRFPEIKELLAAGKLNISLLELALGCANREKLNDAGLRDVMMAIVGMSCKKAKREIASLFPRSSEDLPHDRILPLNDDYSEVRFTASHSLLEKLDEVRGLLSQTQVKAQGESLVLSYPILKSFVQTITEGSVFLSSVNVRIIFESLKTKNEALIDNFKVAGDLLWNSGEFHCHCLRSTRQNDVVCNEGYRFSNRFLID